MSTPLINAKLLLSCMADEIESYHVDWARLSKDSPDHDPAYRVEAPKIVDEARTLARMLDKLTIEPTKQPGRLTLADAMAELDRLVPQADHCTIEMELMRHSGKWQLEWKCYSKPTGYTTEHQTLAAALAEMVAKLTGRHLTVEQAVEGAEGQVQPLMGGLAGRAVGGAQ